jgi:hypothetical protein
MSDDRFWALFIAANLVVSHARSARGIMDDGGWVLLQLPIVVASLVLLLAWLWRKAA